MGDILQACKKAIDLLIVYSFIGGLILLGVADCVRMFIGK